MIRFKNIYSFSLKDFNTARQICDRFQQEQTTAYVYSFATSFEIMKYGISNDKEWDRKDRTNGTWGNRIYKQALGLPGWANRNTNGDTSSLEMAELCKEFFPNITKDDVIITVYDFGYPELLEFGDKTTLTVLEDFENQLVSMHVKNYEYTPHGNVQKTRKRDHVQNFLNMFEIEKS